jgi:hypothetical protein
LAGVVANIAQRLLPQQPLLRPSRLIPAPILSFTLPPDPTILVPSGVYCRIPTIPRTAAIAASAATQDVCSGNSLILLVPSMSSQTKWMQYHASRKAVARVDHHLYLLLVMELPMVLESALPRGSVDELHLQVALSNRSM